MKLAGCGKEVYALLSQQFGEGIVVALSRQFGEKKRLKLFQKLDKGIVYAVRRQLSRTDFSLPVQGNTSKIVQRLAAQSTDMPLEILQALSAKILRLLLHPEILRR